MENILLKVASISPAEIKIDAETEKYWAKFNIIHRIGSIFYNINTVLFFVNFVICLFTMRKIKNNRMLCIISIILFFANLCYTMIYNYGGALNEKNDYIEEMLKLIWVLLILIIQIIIFIKLILNIKRNHREKEEP